MTDSSDPKAPKKARKKSAREPATIDLKATVIDDGAQQDKAWDDVKPEETVLPEPDVRAEDTVGSPEATLDSGTNADSIEPSASAEELPPQSEEPSQEPSQEPGVVPPGPPSAPERRTSTAALIGSSLLGGLVGAGLVYGLQVWQRPTSAQEDQRLAQLEQRVNALGQSRPQSVDLSAVEGRLQALESARGPLDQRLQEIQGAADRAAARAEEAFNRPLPEPPAPQNEAALNDLSQRLSALGNEVRTNAQNAANASNAVQGLDRRLAEHDQRLAALSQQVAQSSKSAEAAGQTGTRVVLAERLDNALRSGMPFADVLEGLKKTGTDPEKLKALESFADKGAPTAAAMLDSFEPLEAQILRDQRAASGEWSDRLLRMMDKVVTVRPVNEPGATGVPATLARIRQALAEGDMGGAAAAWASLPEPARRISEEWGRQMTALAGAQQASREISEESLATLNRSTQ
ncbi:hypothetical protein AA309_16740 [Microvirga vignae]|uniref:Mitochondrial inner membrane protein n=1 Tax=Microvirga vignae TaxID=1225564 RepID=A0A0H1RAH8_9HYPH|nr:hypothetical protein [Microvirga vignae]KLK92064.1 hypothetical protein AA309_16740 [Microvirga vignae]